MSNKTNIAVLLTSHNRKEKTLECLKALHKCILPNDFFLSIFMVDDCSSDGTSIAVASAFPMVHIIQGNGNLFWNRGMHLAWKTAANSQDFDYYLWLNDDTNLTYNGIIELFEVVQTSSSPVIVCGAICSDRNIFSYGLTSKDRNPVLPNNLGRKGMYMNGNCVLIPRDVYIQVGNLDSIFPHAIGDYDYGLRAIKKGFPVIGDNCILFAGAKVIGNVTLGNNVIVAANAVVTKDFPDNAVVGGIPAKILSYKGEIISKQYRNQ